MGNHSSVRRRPPDLRQVLVRVLVRVLAVLLVAGTAVVLGLLLTGRDVPPPEVTGPVPSAGTTPVAVPVQVGDEERAAVLSLAATATAQILDRTADPNALMTPRYARLYRRAVDDGSVPVAAATVVGTGLMGIDRDEADVLVLLDRAPAEPADIALHLRRDRGSWRVDDLGQVTAAVSHLDEPDPERQDVLAAAGQAVPGEVLAAGLASYGPSAASVLVTTDGGRLRVNLTLVDGTWQPKVSELEPVSAG
ncbi:hypothetical protein [Nocardioides sp. SLBN-35]|uniref:hypothetical protein n=1 Tax=Nocardioides sp. SLBN-35 TaxID=2768445 RepID=UPI00114D6978|nr:hypothetical protein [Nocardioides sp. SLBN-35]TQK68557.1 hypothetical protein FBY23_0310 [Nocardioides sp. SLBN-35]